MGCFGVFVRSYWLSLHLAFALAVLSTGPANSQEVSMPPFEDAIVMFYYRDMAGAVNFYEQVLGLEKTLDSKGAKLYRINSKSQVGLVQEGSGYHRVQSENAVMLSLVTDDVDAWFGRISQAEGIEVLKPPQDSDKNPIRAFLVTDPGGYTVEFFQWLLRPKEYLV
jgi:predicted enzyme related to lactoylglutathione lyase